MAETDNQFDIMGGNDASETKEASGITTGGETTSTTNNVDMSGSKPIAAEWTKQLSKEIRDNEAFSKLAGFKNISELAQAYLTAPQTDFEKLDYNELFKRDEFWNAIGVPKADEPYGIEDALGESLKGLADAARKSNLTKGQAKNIAEYFQNAIAPALAEAAQNKIAQMAQDNEAATKKNFPSIAAKLTAEFGQDAALFYNKAAKADGLLNKLRSTGLGSDLQISRALCVLGKAMTEDSSGAGSSRSGAEKTGKTWAEGGGFSYSK